MTAKQLKLISWFLGLCFITGVFSVSIQLYAAVSNLVANNSYIEAQIKEYKNVRELRR